MDLMTKEQVQVYNNKRAEFVALAKSIMMPTGTNWYTNNDGNFIWELRGPGGGIATHTIMYITARKDAKYAYRHVIKFKNEDLFLLDQEALLNKLEDSIRAFIHALPNTPLADLDGGDLGIEN